jgi:carbamoyltransferase
VIILGINSAYHESSACLLKDGLILAAAEEERFTRRKHAKQASVDNPSDLPWNAIYYCLDYAKITNFNSIDHIGFSINPYKRLQNQHFEDIVEEGSWGSPGGEQEFFNNLLTIPEKLKRVGLNCPFTWLDHHLCHAASAFYPGPFHDAAILSIDGIGETTSTMLGFGQGKTLSILKEIQYPASLGFLWEKISKFLGFEEYDACKVMGLAAYGNYRRYIKEFKHIVTLSDNGIFKIDGELLRFRIENYSQLENLFGIKKRQNDQELNESHQDIAASLQHITNEVLLHMTRYLHKRTKSQNLCIAGGIGLNCVANQVVLRDGPFDNIYIQPAANDAGTAIGAAFILWISAVENTTKNIMRDVYLGPSFSVSEIETTLKQYCLNYKRIDNIEGKVAELLSKRNIVAWFQGRMEFGPRALGNRSLLADPRDPEVRELLNSKIKHRESFRPFALSVLDEKAQDWFNISKPSSLSDFMLSVYPAKESVRDKILGGIHVDGTSRLQTVKKRDNPKFHKLISEFFALTEVPLLLNTSFNDSEPIVCTPKHAIDTFIETEIDYLAIGNFLVKRNTETSLY